MLDLATFVRKCLDEGPFDGCCLDGGWVQDEAERAGIIVKVVYDPAIHGDLPDIEPGDDAFVFSDEFKRYAGI